MGKFNSTTFLVWIILASLNHNVLGRSVICNGSYSYSRCCVNHFEDNGTCQECPTGTFGVNCNETCPTNYFGKFCLEPCNCTVGEYCDIVKGCMQNETILFENLSSSASSLQNSGVGFMPTTDHSLERKTPSVEATETTSAWGKVLFFLSGCILTVLIVLAFVFLKSRQTDVCEFWTRFRQNNIDRSYISDAAVLEESPASVYQEIDGQRLGDLHNTEIDTEFTRVLHTDYDNENDSLSTCHEYAGTCSNFATDNDDTFVSKYQVQSLSEPATRVRYDEESMNENGNLNINFQYSVLSLRKNFDSLKPESNNANQEINQDTHDLRITCPLEETMKAHNNAEELEFPLTSVEISKEHTDHEREHAKD